MLPDGIFTVTNEDFSILFFLKEAKALFAESFLFYRELEANTGVWS